MILLPAAGRRRRSPWPCGRHRAGAAAITAARHGAGIYPYRFRLRNQDHVARSRRQQHLPALGDAHLARVGVERLDLDPGVAVSGRREPSTASTVRRTVRRVPGRTGRRNAQALDFFRPDQRRAAERPCVDDQPRGQRRDVPAARHQPAEQGAAPPRPRRDASAGGSYCAAKTTIASCPMSTDPVANTCPTCRSLPHPSLFAAFRPAFALMSASSRPW